MGSTDLGFLPIECNEYRSKSKKSLEESAPCDCRHLDHDPLSACGSDSKCINRMLSVECSPSICRCGANCKNQRFRTRQYQPLAVFDAAEKGRGLRCEKAIPKGAFLIEYVGQILSTASFGRRQRRLSKQGARHFYFMALSANQVIDASYRGNISRFINHSCNPNCVTQKWIVEGKVCVGIFALRNVSAGEEITFDYQFERFGSEAQRCHCGDPACKGVIGTVRRGYEEQRALLSESDGSNDDSEGDMSLSDGEGERVLGYQGLIQHPRPISDPFEMLFVAEMLLQDDARDQCCKLLQSLEETKDHRMLLHFLQSHGLKILKTCLAEHKKDEEIVGRAVAILSFLPVTSRNSIEESELEPVLGRLLRDSSLADHHNSVAAVLGNWKSLEKSYRIPKCTAPVSENCPVAANIYNLGGNLQPASLIPLFSRPDPHPLSATSSGNKRPFLGEHIERDPPKIQPSSKPSLLEGVSGASINELLQKVLKETVPDSPQTALDSSKSATPKPADRETAVKLRNSVRF